jgi:hypothetical protein
MLANAPFSAAFLARASIQEKENPRTRTVFQDRPRDAGISPAQRSAFRPCLMLARTVRLAETDHQPRRNHHTNIGSIMNSLILK